MITVGIVGPESTGKTTLAKSLAAHYRSEWVPEFAREFIMDLDRPYKKSDLLTMAKGQLEEEKRHKKKVEDLLILDTDLFVIKIWSEYKYGECDPWIEQQLSMNMASIYLLTHYDIPYEHDPLRETPEARPELFDLYQEALEKAGAHYIVVQGNKQKRLNKAIKEINDIL